MLNNLKNTNTVKNHKLCQIKESNFIFSTNEIENNQDDNFFNFLSEKIETLDDLIIYFTKKPHEFLNLLIFNERKNNSNLRICRFCLIMKV